MKNFNAISCPPLLIDYKYLLLRRGGLPLCPAPRDLVGTEALHVAPRDGLHAHGAHHPLLHQLQQLRPATPFML